MSARRRSSWVRVLAIGTALGTPSMVLCQDADGLLWEPATVSTGVPQDAVASLSVSEGNGGLVVDFVCGAASGPALSIGSVAQSGRCEVGLGGVVWSLSSFDVLAGSGATWVEPSAPGSAEALPQGMVVAGYDSVGVAVNPCRPSDLCRTWQGQNPCQPDGSPVGQVKMDIEGNAACMIVDDDFGECICASFDVLVSP